MLYAQKSTRFSRADHILLSVKWPTIWLRESCMYLADRTYIDKHVIIWQVTALFNVRPLVRRIVLLFVELQRLCSKFQFRRKTISIRWIMNTKLHTSCRIRAVTIELTQEPIQRENVLLVCLKKNPTLVCALMPKWVENKGLMQWLRKYVNSEHHSRLLMPMTSAVEMMPPCSRRKVLLLVMSVAMRATDVLMGMSWGRGRGDINVKLVTAIEFSVWVVHSLIPFYNEHICRHS